MSREERRAYKRLTKNQDPYQLPAAAQRGRPPRARRRASQPSGEFRVVTRRFLAWTLGGAAVVGLLALSLAWPSGMPFAAYVGAAVAGAWLLLAWLLRLAQRRMASRPPSLTAR